MSGIQLPISGFVKRESIATFAAKHGADELKLAVTVGQIEELALAGVGGPPLMVVANEHYTVSVLVRQAKEAISLAVERGALSPFNAAHMVVLQEGKEAEGAVAVEFVAYDPNRRISRAITSANDKRKRALKSAAQQPAIEGATVGGKYSTLLAESRLEAFGALTSPAETETVSA